MSEIAFVNGVFGPIAEARVSIEDRGFQFGDGIYEVVAAYDRRPFLLDRHMARLRGSARAIHLDYDFDGAPLESIVAEGVRRSGLSDVMVYIQLTRGAAPRSHVIPAGIKPTLVMTFRALPRLPDDMRERGATAMTVVDDRWANCYIKAITLLPNILAKNEALRRGYDEAIYVTAEGEVLECTSANVFVVRGGRMLIPPRTEAILHGVTQAFILECAADIGVAFEERVCDLTALRSADEVFLSSTTAEVLGITSIDDRPVGNGKVGPVTKRMFEAFCERTHAATAIGHAAAASH